MTGTGTGRGRVITERELEEQLVEAQKLEVAGRLASGVAHNLNNMLVIILGNASLALSRLDRDGPSGTQELRSHIQAIVQAGEQAAAVVRQLMRFSREHPHEAVVVDLNGVIRGLDSLLRLLLGEEVELEVRLCAERCNVEVDRTQLEHALMNLALNARQAMPTGGRLTIEIERRPGRLVRLAVADTGVGMDAETGGRIFEPFFTTKESGNGLGLSTVHAFVRESGGSIEVESAPGRGSRFSIDLPELTV